MSESSEQAKGKAKTRSSQPSVLLKLVLGLELHKFQAVWQAVAEAVECLAVDERGDAKDLLLSLGHRAVTAVVAGDAVAMARAMGILKAVETVLGAGDLDLEAIKFFQRQVELGQ